MADMTHLVFDNPPSLSHAEAEVALVTEPPDVVCRVLVQAALHDPDWRWVQTICVRFADDADTGIRGVVAVCIGHLARLHHEIDVDTVLPILERMLSDLEMRGRAEDALDDIALFLSSGESRRQATQLKRRCRSS